MADCHKKTCKNRGCGKAYLEQENTQTSCRYHPDPPIFRDFLKVWPCCDQKSRDFSDFLNIPGCKITYHSDVSTEPTTTIEKKIDQPIQNIPLKKVPREFIVDLSPLQTIEIIPDASLIKKIQELDVKPQNEQNGEHKNMEVKPGMKCLNNGCNFKYIDSSSIYEKCIYHPGAPVFHEGSKYWSCCCRKTGDFDEFLIQPGCESGKHKWIRSDEENKKMESCIHDYFEMGSFIKINIYSKLVRCERSFVKANKTKLSIHIVYGEACREYDIDFNLYDEIIVGETTASATPFKLIISCKKLNQSAWPQLQRG